MRKPIDHILKSYIPKVTDIGRWVGKRHKCKVCRGTDHTCLYCTDQEERNTAVLLWSLEVIPF